MVAPGRGVLPELTTPVMVKLGAGVMSWDCKIPPSIKKTVTKQGRALTFDDRERDIPALKVGQSFMYCGSAGAPALTPV